MATPGGRDGLGLEEVGEGRYRHGETGMDVQYGNERNYGVMDDGNERCRLHISANGIMLRCQPLSSSSLNPGRVPHYVGASLMYT